jgi:DNA transformation protein and related proteins
MRRTGDERMDARGIAEIFADFGPVHVRRVFGGHSVAAEGVAFALELRGELYLKADNESEALFASVGSTPFIYERRSTGTTMRMPYWRMPDIAFDDPDELKRWCRLALAAAERAGAKGEPKRRVRRPRAAPEAGRARATSRSARPRRPR